MAISISKHADTCSNPKDVVILINLLLSTIYRPSGRRPCNFHQLFSFSYLNILHSRRPSRSYHHFQVITIQFQSSHHRNTTRKITAPVTFTTKENYQPFAQHRTEYSPSPPSLPSSTQEPSAHTVSPPSTTNDNQM